MSNIVEVFPKLSVCFFLFPSAGLMASAGLLAVLLLLLCAARTAANSWGQTEGLGGHTGDALAYSTALRVRGKFVGVVH
jgi:NAD(P)H-hydrate repair Nnr-like enzyme with NAD(P)H-hydrate epimerase domain